MANDNPSEELRNPSPPVDHAPAPAPPIVAEGEDAERQMRRISRRSFLWGAAAVGAGLGGLRWLDTRRTEDGLVWPLRRVLETNEDVWRDLSSNSRLATTFPASRIEPLRANGDIGLGEDFDASQWSLQLEGLAEGDGTATVSLEQIKALPRIDIITELRCIEGWSNIVQWTGVRMVDFVRKYPPSTPSGDALDLTKKPDDVPAYAGLATPDGGYYVGLETAALLHPQTLLCYAMNGKPLLPQHGAPLRLAIPIKYGIKNIKRIGTISYTNKRPADYWAEQGYDFYAGH
jgi:DMSO/TMAO reductase YedYZ molybdopterin-dependent catalytic subunit